MEARGVEGAGSHEQPALAVSALEARGSETRGIVLGVDGICADDFGGVAGDDVA
jgi:hypothetical protein